MSEHPKPLALFALSYGSFSGLATFDSISAIVDVVFVSNKQELFDGMRNPACFTVFVDTAFTNNSLDMLSGELKKRGFPWTLIVEKVTAADRDKYIKLGVDEILAQPVNETLLASRCRLMLNRYLEVRDFPVPVRLPPEVNLRDLRAQRKRRDATDPRRVTAVTRPAPEPVKPASAALKDIMSPPVKPAQLLDIVRTRVEEIHQDRDWDRALWPAQSLPQATTNDEVVSAGFQNAVHEISQLFKDCCFSLGAERITLISVRPTYEEADQVISETLLAVASSEEAIAAYPSVPAILFPQIQVGVEKKAAIILNEPGPEQVSDHHRPDVWKLLGGRIEEASAVIPLLSANQTVYAVLFIQFGTTCDADTIKYLEQAATFLGLPKVHYRHVDFMGRIYRGMG